MASIEHILFELAGRPDSIVAYLDASPYDELIVMDQGKILQRGTHDELINQEGMYRDLMQSE